MERINLSNKEANQLTRESIETALLLLLEKKPFETISITELTKKAGVSRPAFYRNYNSKEDIISQIAVPSLKEIADLFQEPNCHHDPNHYVCFFNLLKENQSSLNLYFSHLDKIPFSFFNENRSSLSVEEYYYYRIGTNIYFSIAKDWLNNGCQPSIETMSQILQGIILKLFP